MLELRRRYSSSVPSGGSGRLPAGYQEVEYIQGDGNAWIDTGFIATGGMTCEYQGAWIEGEGKSGYIIGSHDTTSPYNRNSLWYHKNSKEWQFAYGNAIKIPSLSIDAFQKNTYTFSTLVKDAYAKINNDVVYSTYGFNLQPKTSVKIFRIGDFADDILGIIKATLYYAKIWDSNNILIREFIPCRRLSDNEKGMYDIVNDVFYVNQGTGEFLVGADVHYNIPFEYQEVEYLESTGTQYIDVGVSAPDGFVFEADLEITKQVGPIDCIIGAHELSQPYHLNLFAVSVIDNAGLIISAGTRNVYSHTKEYNRKYSVQASTQKGYIYVLLDATPILSDTNLELRTSRNLFLFADNNVANGASQYSAIRLWNNAKIIVNNVLVRDFIPCYRKSNNEAGMYDLVSGEFYTNAGTGEFIVGPLVI